MVASLSRLPHWGSPSAFCAQVWWLPRMYPLCYLSRTSFQFSTQGLTKGVAVEAIQRKRKGCPHRKERTAAALVLAYSACGGDGFANLKGAIIDCVGLVVRGVRITFCTFSRHDLIFNREVQIALSLSRFCASVLILV